ncbi:MAG: NRDE family protein, partial [Gammaproteobacteria bacterium]|nr:NRDE family protein [Gammaproteobacteria bacterium]
MCLILFSWQRHPRYALVFAANRDEYHARATAPAAFWKDAPRVLAGRDLEGGGTWAGITVGGRFAALTNFRSGTTTRSGAPSRGALVADYLRATTPPAAYVSGVSERGADYNGFNLLAGAVGADGGELYWCSNRAGAPRRLEPGMHGISNHLLDTPWPKVVDGKRALASLIDGDAPLDPERVLALLADTRAATDDALPETGVGLELERA